MWQTLVMGRLGWLLVALLLLFFLTSVRFHNVPGKFGESWSVEIVPPWR